MLSIEAFNAARQADLLVDAKRPVQALNLLRPFLNPERDSSFVLVAAARALHMLNDFHGLAQIARRLIDVEPDDSAGYRFLAVAMLGTGSVDAGREAARRAISIEPNVAYNHYILGLAYRVNVPPIYPLALQCYQKAIELEPNEPTWYVVHASTVIDRDEGGWPLKAEGAEEYLRKALELQPENTEALHQLAKLRVLQGRGADGLAGFSRTLRINPQSRDSEDGIRKLVGTLGSVALLTAFPMLTMAVGATKIDNSWLVLGLVAGLGALAYIVVRGFRLLWRLDEETSQVVRQVIRRNIGEVRVSAIALLVVLVSMIWIALVCLGVGR